MAQIIKHRRGQLSGVKSLTARNAEFIVASGSISDLQGPFVFIGSPNVTDEGVAGAFKSVSKIYQGTTAPTITAGTYGSVLDGTPFYSNGNKSLYILNNDGAGGNVRLDLTGNLEGNTISNLTINNITGSRATFSTYVSSSALEVTGNTKLSNLNVQNTTSLNGGLNVNGGVNITGTTTQTGSLNLSGDIKIGGTIHMGDQPIDVIIFNGEISSSIVPDVNNAFDLGSTTNAWRNVYVSGTGYYNNIQASQGNFTNLTVTQGLTVSGSTNLLGPVTASAFVGDGSQLTGVESTLNITGSDGTTTTSGKVNLKTETLTFGGQSSNGLYTQFNDATNTVTYTLDQNIKTGATPTFNQVSLTSAGTTSGSAVRADRSLTINGTTNQVTVSGGTQNLQGDRTWTVGLPSTVNLGSNSSITATSGSIGRIVTTDLYVSGNLTLLGAASSVIISSSVVELDDNIIRLNAYSPFERYAGFEVIDSGSSNTSASLLWDSSNDYWLFMSSSGQSSKLIGTTAGTYGAESSLTNGTIPIATGTNTIGNSLLKYSGTTLSFNTNKFTIDSGTGDTLVSGNFTLQGPGGTDTNSKTSRILFRNSNNMIGFVSTTETTDVLDGILGYKNSNGGLTFSTVIDGGSY